MALNKKIKTGSKYPLVIAIDVTRSMSAWPETIFDKLPLLYDEVNLYLPKTEISFAAFGDAYNDKYPLQVCDFSKGKDLDGLLCSLYLEGKGGDDQYESYELMAFYYLMNCWMLQAIKPIFIFVGDEGFYNSVNHDQIKSFIGSTPDWSRDSLEVMKKLNQKFDVYILRKEYDSLKRSIEDKINSQWQNALGEKKVKKLNDPSRVVDCILGIVAESTDQFPVFEQRLAERQRPEQVEEVMESLNPQKKGLLHRLKNFFLIDRHL